MWSFAFLCPYYRGANALHATIKAYFSYAPTDLAPVANFLDVGYDAYNHAARTNLKFKTIFYHHHTLVDVVRVRIAIRRVPQCYANVLALVEHRADKCFVPVVKRLIAAYEQTIFLPNRAVHT